MELNLDLTDRTVLLLGAAHASRRALRRYSHAGAVVRTASTPEEARRALSRPVDVVVAVADGDPAWGPVLTELRQRHLVVTEPAAAPGGQIILVGGGPGTAELMTLGARKALAEADVVLYDRLAPHEDLDELTHGAELVDVGKRPGRHAVPQGDIEAMLVDHARAGKTVVRLKGGDPFVFGRGREEVSAGAAAGIPVSVVSGVTSAVSVPAAAGIPVTHRDASRMFTVVSGHVPLTDAELAHLAGLGGTLVVLMGMGTLQQLVAGLHRVGMTPTTPVAVVERGYQVDQATTYSTLADAVSTGVLTRCSSPAVVVIGEVVRLGREVPAHIAALAEPAGATSA